MYTSPKGESEQARFRDLQVAQYDWGMGCEGKAGEMSKNQSTSKLITYTEA